MSSIGRSKESTRINTVDNITALQDEKKTTTGWLLPKWARGKNRKVEQVVGAQVNITEVDSEGSLAFISTHLGGRQVMAMFRNEEDAQKFYDKLDELFKGLKKIGNSLKKDKSKIEELLDNVAKKINGLGEDNIALAYNLRIRILKDMCDRKLELDKDNLSKGINETLASIGLLKKIMAPAKPRFFARFTKSKSIGSSEGTRVITNKNNKGCELYKDLPINDVMRDLYDSIRENDVGCVREILNERREDVAEHYNAAELSTQALTHDKRGYILQLLINADLFNVGGFEDKLDEAKVKAQSEPNAFRLKRLLAKISIDEEKKEPKERKYRQQLYSVVPVIIPVNEVNSEENIQQLTEHINENKYSEIEKMLVNGKVDLQDLSGKQLFDILDSTTSKIELKTMKLLLDYGFDISSAINPYGYNIFAIIDKFSSSTLNFLKDRADIKALAKKQCGNYGNPLQLCLSGDNPDLKTVKILFEKFGANDYFSEQGGSILELAIISENPAIVEYLLKQIKRPLKPIYIDNIILKAQHSRYSKQSTSTVNLDKIDKLLEKKFKYITGPFILNENKNYENPQKDLQAAMISGDLQEACKILDSYYVNYNAFNGETLTNFILDEEIPNISEFMQLLANKGLLDANAINLKEFFERDKIVHYMMQIEEGNYAGDNADDISYTKVIRLLKKLREGVPTEDLYVRLTVISKDDSVVTNSEEHIKDFQKCVERNDCKTIASMISSGKIYLPDLSGNHYGEFLEKCARKIKPETMKLLLDNGFYTTAKQQNVNVFLRYIHLFSKDVLHLLKNEEEIFKKLIDEDFKSGNEALFFHIEQNNLKALEYLITQTKLSVSDSDLKYLEQQKQLIIERAESMKEGFANDKKAMKTTEKIIEDIRSLFLSTEI